MDVEFMDISGLCLRTYSDLTNGSMMFWCWGVCVGKSWGTQVGVGCMRQTEFLTLLKVWASLVVVKHSN